MGGGKKKESEKVKKKLRPSAAGGFKSSLLNEDIFGAIVLSIDYFTDGAEVKNKEKGENT